MEAITYKLDQFEGPLDLLMTLIDKNKVNISDIPISLICDQYMEYINEAKNMDMEIASEFIVMASELMLIKSKMLLPKLNEDEEDPRAALADALLRYKQAKEAAAKMAPMYAAFGGRMVKETDEIPPDKKEISPQSVERLFFAMRHLIALNEKLEKAEETHFTPLISKPIVSVELKIIGIIDKLTKKGEATLRELLDNSESRADMIASFIGVLELIKIRKVLILDPDTEKSVHNDEMLLCLNPDAVDEDIEISKEFAITENEG